ncbi:sodium:proton antiporter [Fulvivirgaceae bacterium BMA10]|uniref:Sodium:proton antiporter n=1 Tax=Splendidivirga corallicola TaxID=3051826 RepID=A0ABT8KUJ0_9BACT|nr:sodium:proton antiporter [Fulvivirgaceae bacterium BMA10]
MFQSFTIIVAFAALFSYINHRLLKLPVTIGILILSLILSAGFASLREFSPYLFQQACQVVDNINFREILMDVMLSFLLFAGAAHVNLKALKKERLAVFLFATLGVLISTGIVGVLTYFVLGAIGIHISFVHCLLFGALISPTDPVAVLAILKGANVNKSLELKISGESLFNDGVGVVIFLSILMVAEQGVEHFSFGEILHLLGFEAIGGLIYGTVLGFLGYYLLRTIDDAPKIEVLITLAIAMGGYSLATLIHVSGPLAMVVAGLIIGNRIRSDEFSDSSRAHVDMFWEMLDDMLNAILFVLIGLEMLTLSFDSNYFIGGLLAIVIILIARFISVGLPFSLMKSKEGSPLKTITVLTWGGLRGGISVALALSLPLSMPREVIVFITYVVVVFSILLQGLTIGKLVKKMKFSGSNI